MSAEVGFDALYFARIDWQEAELRTKERSMEMIAEEGSGVIVILNRATPTFMSRAIDMRQGRRQPQPEELRDYGAGAQILTELGVQDMVLLTNTHHSLVGLDAYGLSIVGERAIA